MEVEKFPRYRGRLLLPPLMLVPVLISASVLVGATGVRRWYDDSGMMVPIRNYYV